METRSNSNGRRGIAIPLVIGTMQSYKTLLNMSTLPQPPSQHCQKLYSSTKANVGLTDVAMLYKTGKQN